ncbi:MAG: SHOCT domain-containing protein [Amaricoccus sp.]|uniref:SHOCT domain-containing protein n=1 Tax=Amaricoccus sp. TaxID=1872485 RepID=UPI003314BFD7
MDTTAVETAAETTAFTFWTFLLDVFSIFVFILWFWLIITIMIDLFRRHDISGFGKVIWVIFLVLLPFIGVFAYVLTQSAGMAERNQAQQKQAREELRGIVGFSVSDEIEKLAKLKASGGITEAEYSRLRAKLLQ